MILEVIATCMDDALIAEENGADRLELITAITEGGLTPGIGLVRQAVKEVAIPVFVMVRPHSRSFVYSSRDLDTMAAEVEALADSGAAGVVFGALTPDRLVDEKALERLLPLTGSMEVTFHRAFDEIQEQRSALAVLEQYDRIRRVLTSAGPRPAPESLKEMRQLVEASRQGHITILAGSGLKPQGIEHFIGQTGVSELHFGSAVRYGGQALSPIDPIVLRTLADAVHQTDLLID